LSATEKGLYAPVYLLVGLAALQVGTVGAQEKIVKVAPASRSAQSVYQEQHALFSGNFTLETGLSYTRSDRKQLALNGFLALDAIFLGDISVDEVKADILTLDVLGRWGVTPRMQVDLDAPFLYRRTVYQSTGTSGSTTTTSEAEVTLERQMELGDMSAGLYYQLAPETTSRPDIVWSLRIKAPTGSDPYGIKTVDVAGSNGNLRVPEHLPSGNGVWSASTGLSFVKTVDPAILFANASYFYNRQQDFDDISSDAAVVQPGTIKLGDSFQYGVGTAFAFNETTSLSLSFIHRLTAKSRVRPAGEGWQNIIGSDGNAATLNLGLAHALSKKSSMVFNLGMGLTPDAPDMTVGLKFPYTF
jgi:hypothetical protein